MQTGNKVYIKGMVCQRCINAVRTQLETAGIRLDKVALGEVTLAAQPASTDTEFIEQNLLPLGFSVLKNKKLKLIKAIKETVDEVYDGTFDFPARFRFSDYIAKKLQLDYDYISAAFSSAEKSTVEKYIITQRVEKIKELLVYTNDTLSDIAFNLGFSSVAHLSRQFKQQTGLTPSYFKMIRQQKNDL